MPILALDTATLVSSVALATKDTLLGELTLETKKNHSEQLMPNIEQLLERAGSAKHEIDAVAVSIGPGSFTGLRIGLATAKALAYAWQVPLIGVPTLTAMAFGCPVPGAVLAPTLDAQKGNLYVGLYRGQGDKVIPIREPKVLSCAAAIAELESLAQPVVVMGEAVKLYKSQLAASLHLVIAGPHLVMPRAANIALIGLNMLEQGLTHDPMTLAPMYIRRSEAEELWEKRQGCCK
ncbi:MAG: universal protein YeaZ [Firmicutes bacterium]|nr:universal protein YeaZ [Bacillota bacterium]